MFSVQPRRRSECYEELRTVRVWTAVCHRYNTCSCVFKISCDFILKLISVYGFSSSAGSVVVVVVARNIGLRFVSFRQRKILFKNVPCWISSLNHKSSDNTMKDCISVISSFRKFLKVLTRSRRVFGVQFDRERSHRSFNLYIFVCCREF